MIAKKCVKMYLNIEIYLKIIIKYFIRKLKKKKLWVIWIFIYLIIYGIYNNLYKYLFNSNIIYLIHIIIIVCYLFIFYSFIH